MGYVYATDKADARLSHAVLPSSASEANPALCGYEPEVGSAWVIGGTAQYGRCAKCERELRGETRRGP